MKFKTILLLAPVILLSFSAANAGESSKTPQAICSVSCVDPTVSSEGKSVLAVLNATTKALANRDFAAMATYLDPNCTTYDEGTKKMVVGRDNIIKDVKESVEAEEHRLKVPAISFVIDHPYVQVTGDQAVVSFTLIKEIGGATPAKFESHTTDVFIKRNGEWKKLHFLGEAWKEVRPAG